MNELVLLLAAQDPNGQAPHGVDPLVWWVGGIAAAAVTALFGALLKVWASKSAMQEAHAATVKQIYQDNQKADDETRRRLGAELETKDARYHEMAIKVAVALEQATAKMAGIEATNKELVAEVAELRRSAQ